MRRNINVTKRPLVKTPVNLLFTLFFCGSILAAAPAGSTCYVPSGGTYIYSSIQAAINDSGCSTVRLAAGRYLERINIARSISIIGSGATVTTIDGQQTGAVVTASGDLTIDGVTITNGLNNLHPGFSGGGGIEMTSGNLKLLNSIVQNNKSALGNGGGVNCQCTTATIQDSMISNNSAETMGGGVFFMYGTSLRLIRTTIANNKTSRDGGGVYANVTASATVTIENSTIANNYPSGFQTHDGRVYLSSSTIANNSPIGLYMEAKYGEFNLKSSIVSNNGQRNCYFLNTPPPGTGVRDLGNNLRWPSWDTTCVGTFADPMLWPLANRGGIPDVMLPQYGSYAIDRGSCSNNLNIGVPVDARLLLRAGFGCDIGAADAAASVSWSPNAAWWKLDEEPGQYMAQDSSGRGLSGSVNGGSSGWSPSHPNTISFNRGSLYAGSGAWISAPVATTAVDAVSLTAWVNCAGCASFSNNMVPAYVGNTGSSGFGLFITRSDMHVRLLLGGRTIFDFGYTLPTANVWTHLALVRDRGVWRLYANGNQVGGTTTATPAVPAGSTLIGASSSGSENFGGWIDDVRVYDRPLYPIEVQWLATGDK